MAYLNYLHKLFLWIWLLCLGSFLSDIWVLNFFFVLIFNTNVRGCKLVLTLKILCAGGICDPGDSHENDVALYAKTEGRKEHITLDTLSYSSYKVHIPICVSDGPTPVQVKTVETLLNAEDKSLFW